MIRSYLDANASTRPTGEVVEAVARCMAERFLNPSSAAAAFLQPGLDPLRRARAALGALLRADPEDFILTSGASEANSWVASTLGEGDHVVASAIEHPSLRLALEAAKRRGAEVTWVGPDVAGEVPPGAVMSAVRPSTRLVTVMLANNETGVVQPVHEIARLVSESHPSALLHTDATQAVGRIPIDLEGSFALLDLVSVSAHKIHGPRGVGALYMRPGAALDPLIYGEQDLGLRGGTANSPGAAGFAVALEQAADRMPLWEGEVRPMREQFEAALLRAFPGSWINGAGAPRLPNTISLTVPGLDAADAVDRLALAGVCASTGAACSAGADEPSHVLLAMGLSYADARSTLRFSLSRDTRPDEVRIALEQVELLVAPPGAGRAEAVLTC